MELTDIGKKLSPMTLFLLAAIASGKADTFYSLQKEFSLQPGGIRPALENLEAWGLVKREGSEQAGPRRRRRFRITDFGVTMFNEWWSVPFNRRDLDMEDVLRLVTVAGQKGLPEHSDVYLRQVAEERRKRAHEREVSAATMKREDPFSTYAWMFTLCEAERLKAEANAFEEIRQQLRRDKAARTAIEGEK